MASKPIALRDQAGPYCILSLDGAGAKGFYRYVKYVVALMPPHHRAHAEETIQELTTSLRIVREGPQPGKRLPSLLQEKVQRRSGRFPSLEDLGVEPRIERGGLRATEARLAELERC